MPTYFHTLPTAAGLTQLEDDACSLLDFAVLRLPAGAHYEGAVPPDREILLVMLAGKIRLEVGETVFESVGGRANVFAGNPHSVYLPRGARFVVTALTPTEIALPSGPSVLDTEPYEVRPESVQGGQWGTLNYTRHFREILVATNDRPASSLIVGETITPSGHWSTYPPHKHERPAGSEVFHEEMYYFRLSSPEGFGLTRHYSPERGYDATYTVKHDTLLSMPHGYHTYVGAPGYQSYYLWFLAGDARQQGVSLDPDVGWVQKTVGMI